MEDVVDFVSNYEQILKANFGYLHSECRRVCFLLEDVGNVSGK